MKTVTRDDILYSLRLMGIREGDILLVHSALSSIGDVAGGPDSVIDALLDAVGDEGTIVMSTLTGWFQPFDAQTSPSAVGTISEVFRRRPGVLRSLHPVHSVAAFGKHAATIVAGHENCPTGCVKVVDIPKLFDIALPLLQKDPLFFICKNENCNSCHWSRLLYTDHEIDLSRYTHNHCSDDNCEICVI